MYILPQNAEECNVIPTANNSHSAAFDESISNENVLTRSGEEDDKTLMLSRELALDINPKRADLTASFILYGLYTWQISKRKSFVYNPKINGKPAAYRSVRELEQEYPWLAHNTILKALRRAEAGLQGEFIMEVRKHGEQDQLHFLLSETLIKKYNFDLSFKPAVFTEDGERLPSKWKREKSGLISFQRNDAIRYGTMGAILVGNLKYVLDAGRNVDPLEDEAGNIYRQLSPTALTKPVKNEKGEMKAPLPVSPDTITRELNNLKNGNVLREHPLQNNFFTLVAAMKPLEANAAKVTTLAAKVNTSAAKVTTQTEVLRRNAEQMNDMQLLFETSDSNRDRNTDGKCIRTQSVSLRETDCVSSPDESFHVRKQFILSLANEAIRLSEQRGGPEVPKLCLQDYAVYQVEDYDKVSLSHYELPYDILPIDPNTGKIYSRQVELDNMVADVAILFDSLGMTYHQKDLAGIRALFDEHPAFTVDHVHELLTFGINFGTGELVEAPAKGHDYYYFRRRIKSAKQFLRYLPQLIKEWYVNEAHETECHVDGTGKHWFDYSGMEPPFLDIVFSDGKTPVTWFEVTVKVEKPEIGCRLGVNGVQHEFLTGQTVLVETKRLKLVFYEEFMSDDYDPYVYGITYAPDGPFHAKMLELPIIYEQITEPTHYSFGAICKWDREHGQPKLLTA